MNAEGVRAEARGGGRRLNGGQGFRRRRRRDDRARRRRDDWARRRWRRRTGSRRARRGRRGGGRPEQVVPAGRLRRAAFADGSRGYQGHREEQCDDHAAPLCANSCQKTPLINIGPTSEVPRAAGKRQRRGELVGRPPAPQTGPLRCEGSGGSGKSGVGKRPVPE